MRVIVGLREDGIEVDLRDHRNVLIDARHQSFEFVDLFPDHLAVRARLLDRHEPHMLDRFVNALLGSSPKPPLDLVRSDEARTKVAAARNQIADKVAAAATASGLSWQYAG